jgi:hypothetical protein
VPIWPQDTFQVEELSPAIEARLDALFRKYSAGLGLGWKFCSSVVWLFVKPKILGKVKNITVNALVAQGLMTPL